MQTLTVIGALFVGNFQFAAPENPKTRKPILGFSLIERFPEIKSLEQASHRARAARHSPLSWVRAMGAKIELTSAPECEMFRKQLP